MKIAKDEFCYVVQCPHCKTKYWCNGHIELIEIEETKFSVKVAEP